jgi:hypothetical protein
MKYFNTLKDIEKNIGKYVFFYYTEDGKIDGDIIYGWAKKITKIQEEKNFIDKLHPLRHHSIYGTDRVVFVDNQKFIQHTLTPHYEGREERHSNAQQFARELTITEKLLCRIFLKKQEAIEKSTH